MTNIIGMLGNLTTDYVCEWSIDKSQKYWRRERAPQVKFSLGPQKGQDWQAGKRKGATKKRMEGQW